MVCRGTGDRNPPARGERYQGAPSWKNGKTWNFGKPVFGSGRDVSGIRLLHVRTTEHGKRSRSKDNERQILRRGHLPMVAIPSSRQRHLLRRLPARNTCSNGKKSILAQAASSEATIDVNQSGCRVASWCIVFFVVGVLEH